MHTHHTTSNLILTVISVLLIAMLTTTPAFALSDTKTSQTSTISRTVKLTPIPYYVETTDRAELRQLITDATNRRDAASNIVTSALTLGCSATDQVMLWARQEYKMANDAIEHYTAALQDTYDLEWALAYNAIKNGDKQAAADYIWARFIDAGFTPAVAAGIMGNIMAEVGGQTLYIQYWLDNGEYSGICQWSREYFPDASGKDLQSQCDYLLGNIEEMMTQSGDYYRIGFTYDDFIALDSAKAAAAAFCLCYEKCGMASYEIRKSNAVAALQYYS